MDFLLIALLALGGVFSAPCARTMATASHRRPRRLPAAPERRAAAVRAEPRRPCRPPVCRQRRALPPAPGLCHERFPGRRPRSLSHPARSREQERSGRRYGSMRARNCSNTSSAERAELAGDQHTEVMYVDTQLVRRLRQRLGPGQRALQRPLLRDRQEQVEEDIKGRCGTSSATWPGDTPPGTSSASSRAVTAALR